MMPQTVAVRKVTATVEAEPRAVTTAQYSNDNEMMVMRMRRREMVKETFLRVI